MILLKYLFLYRRQAFSGKKPTKQSIQARKMDKLAQFRVFDRQFRTSMDAKSQLQFRNGEIRAKKFIEGFNNQIYRSLKFLRSNQKSSIFTLILMEKQKINGFIINKYYYLILNAGYIVYNIHNMDTGLDKRMKFRQSIRRRTIEQIKKTKRQMFEKQFEQLKIQADQQKLYHKVIHNSQEVFEEREKYLQLLREALVWQKIYQYKSIMPQILLNLVKLYDDVRLDDCGLLLLIECIALIYFETTIQFDQLTKKCILICDQIFTTYKVGDPNEKNIRNRCLVALCNITCTNNETVLRFCEEMCLLEKLELFVQDFPVQDKNKVNMLGIYGNMINYHLSCGLREGQPSYYPELLRQCVEQNYNSEVLAKTIECVVNILKLQSLDTADIAQNMDCLFVDLLQANFFLEGSEELLMVITEQLANKNYGEDSSRDLARIFDRLCSLLELFCRKYSDKVNNGNIVKTFLWVGLLYHKYQPQNESQKLHKLLTKLCNYWTELQDDANPQFQLFFFRFLRLVLQNPIILASIYQQWQEGVNQENAITAPTWEIVQQFLIKARVEDPQTIEQYLHILNIGNLSERVDPGYKDSIIEKIEGCYYSQINNSHINPLAESVLEKYNGGENK